MDFSNLLSTALNLVIFIIILGLAILVHEAGHFIVARWLKIKVEEFAIGFGPILLRWHWWNTLFTIRAIPLGGFNKIVGEGIRVKQKDSYSERPYRHKLAVLVAGATMNILLAIFVAQLLLMFTGFRVNNPLPYIKPPFGEASISPDNLVVVLNVAEWSSLAKENLPTPFILIELNDQKVTSTKQVQDFLQGKQNQKVTIEYRDIPPETELLTSLDLQQNRKSVDATVSSEGKIGIGFLDTTSLISYDGSIFSMATAGLAHNGNLLYLSGKILSNLVQEAIRSRSVAPVGDSLVGLVGFYKAVDLAREADGFLGLVSLTILLNLNLGIMNLLPIPTLDGGHIVIRFIERLRRKRFSDNTVGVINLIGLFGLVVLAILITVKDIRQFFL